MEIEKPVSVQVITQEGKIYLVVVSEGEQKILNLAVENAQSLSEMLARSVDEARSWNPRPVIEGDKTALN